MQSNLTCSIDGCETRAVARGWCHRHYQRWRRRRDPGEAELLRIYGTTEERFWPRVNKNGPVPSSRPDLGNCWLWTASCDPRGYGHLGGFGLAHHVLVGKPAKGLVYDHLCRVHSCVRPEHLEAVTQAENIRRGDAPEAMRQFQLKKTHCPQGHPYEGGNLYMSPGTVSRECRACRRDRVRRWRANRPFQSTSPTP